MFYRQIHFMFWKISFICLLLFLIYILHLRFFILTSNVIIKYIMLFYILKTLYKFLTSIYRLKRNPHWFNQQRINWWIQALWLKMIWPNLVNYIWDILDTNHRILILVACNFMSCHIYTNVNSYVKFFIWYLIILVNHSKNNN
jgi:hypothetical protein